MMNSSDDLLKLSAAATHTYRKEMDRIAGLYNERGETAANVWREFLEANHEMVSNLWPDIREAVVDARRWENPFEFDGSFAEKVARMKPLPAISTIGQSERLIIRALVMLGLDQPAREELIRTAYETEKAARKRSAEEVAQRASPGKVAATKAVDLSKIQL